ncbi:MAG: 30S ribosomal protein S8 [Gammaproteobacteria bacterium]
MSMQDPIADMLTRIRNAQAVGKVSVAMPSSKRKVAIVQVLKEAGFIISYQITEDKIKPELSISLKYYQERPVIARIQRVSRSCRRVYRGAKALTRVNGFGMTIVSTSQGVMADSTARKKGIGGEILCEVA